MRAARQKPQDVLGAEHGEEIRLRIAIDRREEYLAAATHQPGAGSDHGCGFGYVLEELHAGDDVEGARMFGGVFLGACVRVDDVGLALQQVELGDAQRFLGEIDAGHRGAARRHRFGEDAAAATDIEHPLAGERRALVDPAQAQRVDVVQRPEFALRVPPPVRELVNLLDLGRAGLPARVSQKKSPAEAGLPFAQRALYLLVEPDSLGDELPELPGLRVPEGLYPHEPLEPGALTVPLALPELEPVVPVVPAAPVVAGARPAVCSRLPSSSASTRRSGCRQAISFWFLLLSGPMRLHWSPVTGSLSPLPATCSRLLSTPFDFR